MTPSRPRSTRPASSTSAALLTLALLLTAPACGGSGEPSASPAPAGEAVVIQVRNTAVPHRARRITLVPVGGDPVRLGTVPAGATSQWEFVTGAAGRYVLRASGVQAGPDAPPSSDTGVLSDRFVIDTATEEVVWDLAHNAVDVHREGA